MPLAVLEYDLPEEEKAYRIAIDGGKWLSVAVHLDGFLRRLIRHEGRSEFEVVRKQLLDEMAFFNLTFD